MRYRTYLLMCGALLAAPYWPAYAGEKDAVKPVNLDKLNTDADEDDPFPAADGLSFYYAVKAGKTWDVYQSKRKDSSQNWPAGKVLLSVKGADTRSPFLHKAMLYFATNEVPDPKLAELKNFDLMQRSGSLAPIPLLGISEKADEMHPWVTPGGKEFYFSRKTADGWVLFVAQGPTPGPIGKAKEVGFPAGFHHATLTSSTLSMYLQGPLEGGRTGIFHSKRTKVGGEWSKPEPVTALNHADSKRGDMSPALSASGERLYFVSDRPGGQGGLDVWYVPTMQLK